MGVERQQGTVYQLSLLEWGEEAVRPGVPGEGGTGTGANEEQQGPTASESTGNGGGRLRRSQPRP